MVMYVTMIAVHCFSRVPHGLQCLYKSRQVANKLSPVDISEKNYNMSGIPIGM